MRIHFNGSPTPTVGVEVELQIIDRETKSLVSGAPRILERVTDSTRVKPELIASTVELNTDVCANIETVRREVADRFRSLLALCDELGYELACVGTHPFSRWAEQEITPKERYRLLVDRCQWPARRLMITLVNARAIESVREIWWDVRPHPEFGTVEVRICDGLPTLDDIIAMTAMIQALVVWLGDQYDEGIFLPLQRYWIVRENKWRAARWALDADMIIDEDGRLEPLAESVGRLIESLEPVSERLGSHAELMRVREIRRRDPAASVSDRSTPTPATSRKSSTWSSASYETACRWRPPGSNGQVRLEGRSAVISCGCVSIRTRGTSRLGGGRRSSCLRARTARTPGESVSRCSAHSPVE